MKKHETVTAWYSAHNNSVQVRFVNAPKNVSFKLYASNGQLVKTASILNSSNTCTFNLPALAKGIYMLNIVADGESFGKKIFIDR
ncbi:MAG: T9SS type A sorting domain-containing protein [Bacteroidetes bacterium]|nr:T9SS type A sorting domain-containing protein [Bacteroidota bacterium]